MKLDLVDCAVTAGIVVLVYGVWCIYPPAAAIVAGMFLILIGLITAAHAAKRPAPKAKETE